MAIDPVREAVLGHYRDDDAERVRLDSPHGTVEYLRTCELLERHLPDPPAQILDIGGGPGRYAAWLVERGNAVTLIDPVERHIAYAHAIAGVRAVLGDARALDVDDDAADATLVLGPLYHLDRRADRIQALTEARRVTRAGGIVAAAVISRYAALIDYASHGALEDDGPAVHAATQILRDGWAGDPTEDGSHAFYFHRPDDLLDEMRAAGFTDVRLYGVEGPAVAAVMAGSDEDRRARIPSVITAARAVESDRDVVATSLHLLAIGSAGTT